MQSSLTCADGVHVLRVLTLAQSSNEVFCGWLSIKLCWAVLPADRLRCQAVLFPDTTSVRLLAGVLRIPIVTSTSVGLAEGCLVLCCAVLEHGGLPLRAAAVAETTH